MPDGTFNAGRYTTEFEPALSFRVSEGWKPIYPESPDALRILGPEAGEIDFSDPSHVFDPSTLSSPKEVSPPENTDEWVSWFRRYPNVNASEPVPVSVGGASGLRIDVTSTAETYVRDLCGPSPCIPLFPYGGTEVGNLALFGPSEKNRFLIVDVKGETVVINVVAWSSSFDEFLPKAQKLLDAVEWERT